MRTVPVVAAAALALLPTPARAATVAAVPLYASAGYRNTVVYGGLCSYADGVLALSSTAAADSAVPATVWARCFFWDNDTRADLGGIEASGVVAANTTVMAVPPAADRLCHTVIAYHPGLYASTGPGRAGSSWCSDLDSV